MRTIREVLNEYRALAKQEPCDTAACLHEIEEIVAAHEAQQQEWTDKVFEKLAAYAHEAWSGWMVYLFSKTFRYDYEHGEAAAIEARFVERWRRQMNTSYAELPEHEKESDRNEATKIIAICAGATLR